MSSYSAKNRQVRKQYSLSVGENIFPDSHMIKIKSSLHNLFDLIDKEIDALINENTLLRERIETLEELIVNSGHPLETIEGKINLSSKDKYVSTNKNLSSQQSHPQQQQIPFSVSSVKRDSMVAASQISQKIKSTYKLKTSGKIFKGQSSSSSSHLIGTFEWHKDGVWYITSSQRNSRQYIATASADSTVNICDVTKIDYNLSPSTVYSGHQSSVNCVKFNPNNDLMLTASGDGTAHIWKFLPEQRESDLESPSNNNEEATIIKTPLLELNEHHNVVVSCDWLSGVDQCVTASWDQMANIYDYHTGEMIVELVGHDQALTDVCAHDSARLIVTSSQDTTFRLWDFRDAIHSVSVFQGHSRSVTSTCFLSADKIISGGDDRTVKIWDLKNMRSPLVTISMESGINKLSVSKQHNLFAIPLDNRNVRIYDINGNRICRLSRDSHNRMVTCSTWLNPIENSIAPNAPSSSSSSALNVHQSSSSLAHKSNSITLFTCAFDRRICAWNIMTEKQ